MFNTFFLTVLFMVLILLIIRISNLNNQISGINEQLSEYATIEYVNGLLYYKKEGVSVDFEKELCNLRVTKKHNSNEDQN